MTTHSDFSVSGDGAAGRYEMPFFIVIAVFSLGAFLFNAYLLALPHIHGILTNLLGIVLLAVVFLALFIYFLRQLWRLGFEVRSATVQGNYLKVGYRFLGEKDLRLPYAGRVTRGLRVMDFRNERGHRSVSIVSRGLLDRVTVPAELARSDELVQLLART